MKPKKTWQDLAREALNDESIKSLKRLIDAASARRGEMMAAERERKFLADPEIERLQVQADLCHEATQIGLKMLAKKYHPDVGGDAEKMKIINEMRQPKRTA
jgi:hypothetical protein